jgi:hypothetical protein
MMKESCILYFHFLTWTLHSAMGYVQLRFLPNLFFQDGTQNSDLRSGWNLHTDVAVDTE